MLKLLENFHITKIRINTQWNRSKLNQANEHNFVYKNFLISLETQFQVIGYTAQDNMAIVNFGYSVEIKKWSNRDQQYQWIPDLDEQSGRSTKQYFDDKEARKLLVRFIEKTIFKYLRDVTPAIIIRGALSDIKVELPRYTQLDANFFNAGYKKRVYNIKEFDSLYKITHNPKDDDVVVWAYSKNENHFDQLVDVYK